MFQPNTLNWEQDYSHENHRIYIQLKYLSHVARRSPGR